jgi:hypothetical protein
VSARYSAVAARAGHRCEYCRAPEAIFNFPFEVEHVIPRVSGGSDDDANLSLACRSCNRFKSDCTDVTDEITHRSVLLFDPRKDDWHDHFEVRESGEVSGKTASGRVTAVQLRMNSPAQVAARLQWMRLGLYP